MVNKCDCKCAFASAKLLWNIMNALFYDSIFWGFEWIKWKRSIRLKVPIIQTLGAILKLIWVETLPWNALHSGMTHSLLFQASSIIIESRLSRHLYDTIISVRYRLDTVWSRVDYIVWKMRKLWLIWMEYAPVSVGGKFEIYASGKCARITRGINLSITSRKEIAISWMAIASDAWC